MFSETSYFIFCQRRSFENDFKTITYLALTIIGAYAALFILKTIDSHGITDQFNPLVKEDVSYVKTTEVSTRIDDQLRSYSQSAFNKEGKRRN